MTQGSEVRRRGPNKTLRGVRPAQEGETGEVERRCRRCQEWWPLTAEFYPLDRRRGREVWHNWCRACHCEYAADRRRKVRSGEKGGVA